MRIGDSRATKIGVVASTKALALVLFWRPRVSAPKPGRNRNPAPRTGSNSCTQVLGGLREKKLFCPGNSFRYFCSNTSRINSRPAKPFGPTGYHYSRAVCRKQFDQQGRSLGRDDQERSRGSSGRHSVKLHRRQETGL